MANDPDGKWLIVAAVVAQGLGFYTIRRIINVKI
jgi:Flp pilus assembly protein TadB